MSLTLVLFDISEKYKKFLIGRLNNFEDGNNDLLERIAISYEELKQKYPEPSG